MAVSAEESKKLLMQAQKDLDELRTEGTTDQRKQELAENISKLVRYATNMHLAVDPKTGAMSGKILGVKAPILDVVR